MTVSTTLATKWCHWLLKRSVWAWKSCRCLWQKKGNNAEGVLEMRGEQHWLMNRHNWLPVEAEQSFLRWETTLMCTWLVFEFLRVCPFENWHDWRFCISLIDRWTRYSLLTRQRSACFPNWLIFAPDKMSIWKKTCFNLLEILLQHLISQDQYHYTVYNTKLQHYLAGKIKNVVIKMKLPVTHWRIRVEAAVFKKSF